MNTYQIEKNVPISADRQSAPGRTKYPLGEMQIGDSILIPSDSHIEVIRIRSTIYSWARKFGHGVKFTVRNVGRPATHVRVWRIL